MSVTESNIPCAPQYSISEVLDRYLIRRGITSKKYYPAMLTIAMDVWKDLFQGVLWVSYSKWFPLKAGDPYPYIEVPKGAVRFFTVNTVDDCGNIVSLYYNSQLNVIPEPLESSCSKDCGSCGCSGGLCEDANSMIMTEKELFVISGQSYKEKKWTKYCKNGDIIEYTETPVKKYNDRRGSGGDFDSSYNDDYSIGYAPAFENMNVVYLTSQKILCKLKVRPCGCPEDTEENAKALSENCGCYLNPCKKRKRCYPIFEPINGNGYGETKISDCGNKFYYRPPHPKYCAPRFKMPTHLQVSYQVSGERIDAETMLPESAREAMFAGIDYYSKQYNGKYNISEKLQAEIKWEKEKQNLILYYNPIRISFLSNVQDAVVRW